MTPDASRRVVAGSLFVTGALVSVKALSNDHLPTIRNGLGLVVAGVFLSVGAEAAPSLAASFAVLLAVAAVMDSASDAFGAVNRGLQAGSSALAPGSKR